MGGGNAGWAGMMCVGPGNARWAGVMLIRHG